MPNSVLRACQQKAQQIRQLTVSSDHVITQSTAAECRGARSWPDAQKTSAHASFNTIKRVLGRLDGLGEIETTGKPDLRITRTSKQPTTSRAISLHTNLLKHSNLPETADSRLRTSCVKSGEPYRQCHQARTSFIWITRHLQQITSPTIEN